VVRILVSLVVLLVSLWFFGTLLGSLGALATRPYFVLRTWLVESTATIPEYFRARNEILSEIGVLKGRLAAKSGSDATISKLLQENEELRRLLSVSDEPRIVAGVIGRPPFLPYDSILLDRGERDGIQAGAVVYMEGERAIGYISRTYTTSSLVTLFSTPGIESTAYIYGPNIYTTLYGIGGGVMRITVPQGIPLHEHDVVVVPSIESGIIGTIKSVVSNPTEPEQSGFVVFDISLQSLHYVGVSVRTMSESSFEDAATRVGREWDALLRVAVPPELLTGTATSTASTTGPTDEEVLE
jgi:hypothetical protein